MQIPFYQIDAFASQVFAGNPAGVCLLQQWLPDNTMQSIANENNLPETAFLVQNAGGYDLRWVPRRWRFRFFAPGAGIPEDTVTGSAHCTLIPYWAERLGKKKLHALQVSKRGGELFCEHRGDRVAIGGRCVTYLSGTITI
jgi:predicted PhzF superfamily epimerase YddE/YHI9